MNNQAAGYGGRPTAVGDTARLSEIEEQFRVMAEVIDLHDKTIGELNARLASVLRQQEGPATQGISPKPVLVPLAERIQSAACRIRELTGSIKSILQRLEL